MLLNFKDAISVSMLGLAFGVDDDDEDTVSITVEQQLLFSKSHCIDPLLPPLKILFIIVAMQTFPILSIYNKFKFILR